MNLIFHLQLFGIIHIAKATLYVEQRKRKKSVYACFVGCNPAIKNFYSLNKLVTISRAGSGRQPFEPIRHAVLGPLVDGGICLPVICIGKILR